ncbi:DNA-binding protein, partial [Ornithobacterium rhinotracheale]
YTSKTKRKLKIIEGDENSENIIDTKTFDISDDIHKLKLTPNATGKYILTLKADSKQVVIDNIKWTK